MIHLITSFYIINENENENENDERSKNRNNELVECLKQNILSEFITSIYLFVEDYDSLNRLINDNIINNKKKISIISIGKKPSYSDLFTYAIENLDGKICMICHSDIHLYECCDICINNISNNIFALTHYEYDMNDIHIKNYNGKHRAFIFKTQLNKNILDNALDTFNPKYIENIIINNMVSNNYALYNPSYQIKIKNYNQYILKMDSIDSIETIQNDQDIYYKISPSIYSEKNYNINNNLISNNLINIQENIDNINDIQLYCKNKLFYKYCDEYEKGNCNKNHSDNAYYLLWFKYMDMIIDSPYNPYNKNV
jgi:hypothetical protein